MKPVGEPDAVAPHVRFDERGWETGRCRMAQATAPILDSTISEETRWSARPTITEIREGQGTFRAWTVPLDTHKRRPDIRSIIPARLSSRALL